MGSSMKAKKQSEAAKPERPTRADAQRNYDHLLAIAREVVAEQGTEASLRDVARRAGVGLGTLYRHFPTRDALLEALLRARFDALAESARALEHAADPYEALVTWIGELAAGAATYRGLSSAMIATLSDESSSLHASCAAMRKRGGRLLSRAQREGLIRADVDGLDLFAMVTAVSSLVDQSEMLSARRQHFLQLLMDGFKQR
ncbi:Transcriptional regulator, TetR family protein [Minicystis rosea]|nr:Transcriptional regulator, TetR family protein [Minicystis rosea]